jgi:hypothetical protein
VTANPWGLRTIGGHRDPADEPPVFRPETDVRRGGSGEGAPVAVRTARKEGREVVTIRCFEESEHEFSVECEVYPVSGLLIEPLRPGPYRFTTLREASAFIEEAALCLKYLGCDVA